MSSLRSKQGLLQIYKSKKSKKWKMEWKTYFFKVTGSTYLHYFRQNEAMALDAKPKDQIFIKRISSVEIPPEAPKNGNFVFEVHHSAGGSSPWILSADSEEERRDWMETIKPNSTTMLHNLQIKDIHQRNKTTLKHSTSAVSPQLRSGWHHDNKMVDMAANKSPNMQHRQLRHAVSAQNISSLHPSACANEYSSPNLYQLMQSANHDCSISLKYGGGRTSPSPQTKMMPHSPRMDDRTRRISHFYSLPVPLPSPVLKLPPPEMMPPHSPKMSQPSSPLPPLTPTENSPRMDGRSRVRYITRSPSPLPSPPPTLQVSSPEKVPYSPKAPRPSSLPFAPPAIQVPSIEMTPPITNGKSIMITGSPAPILQVSLPEKVAYSPKAPRPSSLPFAPPAIQVPSIEMTPPITNGTCQVDRNGDELTQSGNQYLGLSPQIKFRFDDICLLKDHQESDEVPYSPFDVTPPTTPTTTDPIFESLQSQFTGAQIQALVDMLAKMNDKGGGGGSEANISAHFNKAANTHREAMLVTDDDDTFNERPKWATANDEQIESLPDTCTVSIPRASLTNMKKIGEGHFGNVYSAIYTTKGLGPDYSTKVAVKVAKNGCTEAQRRNILQEVSVMTNMVHPNLVKFYGINEENPDELPWLVLEYMPYGSLKDFLQNSPTKKSPESLVKYMVDVAMGMHYIAERGLVHRDLAARNVLVGHSEICKVADFGLLRELSEDDSIYVSSSIIPCPLRWMPPEAISKSLFSVASDVWSFGILQWEMMNPGKLPYANFESYEVVSKIFEGYRMPTPRGCPPVVARIMKSCWHADPKKRPSFLLITTLLTTKFTTQQATSNRQNGASPKLNDNIYECICNECDSCLSNSHI